jgi:hypothetical protein
VYFNKINIEPIEVGVTACVDGTGPSLQHVNDNTVNDLYIKFLLFSGGIQEDIYAT